METKGKEMKILLNPIGGLYLNPEINQWVYQRPTFNGIYPETVVVDIAIPLADILKTIGMKVYSTRLLNKIYRGNKDKISNSMGESHNPRYRESCVQYLKSISVFDKEEKRGYIPSEIYNEGSTFLEKDFNARINYAKFLNVDMMITIDITSYANDPGIEAVCNKAIGSETLANYMVDEIAKRTRSVVRGTSYAEEAEDMKFNVLTCPAITIKCGSVLDIRSANMLVQGFFRQWISLGMFAGIWRYLNK